jgi:cytochrome b involved in lipid metabolism
MSLNVIQIGLAIGLVVLSLFLFSFLSSGKAPAKKAASKPAKKAITEIRGPFSKEEVAKHNNRNDCWIIVDNLVYDITSYIDEHPGGDEILKNAGGDASIGVHGPQHPASMWDVLALYFIGDLKK